MIKIIILLIFILSLFLSDLTKAHFNNNNCQYPPNIHYNPCYLIENKLIFLEQQINNKIQILLSRIEALERQLGMLHKVSMNEWNTTEYGNIYKIFNNSKTWEEANNICITFGARLASIDSDYKNAFVRNMIERNFGKNESSEVWIGLKTKAELTNNPNSHFNNFGEDEQINGCAIMGLKGKWKIRSCSNLRPFVCEQII